MPELLKLLQLLGGLVGYSFLLYGAREGTNRPNLLCLSRLYLRIYCSSCVLASLSVCMVFVFYFLKLVFIRRAF